jgi:hypothetical protein
MEKRGFSSIKCQPISRIHPQLQGQLSCFHRTHPYSHNCIPSIHTPSFLKIRIVVNGYPRGSVPVVVIAVSCSWFKKTKTQFFFSFFTCAVHITATIFEMLIMGMMTCFTIRLRSLRTAFFHYLFRVHVVGVMILIFWLFQFHN